MARINFGSSSYKPAGATSYTKGETLPSFDVGEFCAALGTDYTTTPAADCYGGAAGVITGGGPGALGLAVNGTNKITLPAKGRAVFNVNSAMTLLVICKAALQAQHLFGDYNAVAGDGRASIILATAAILRSLATDSAGVSVSSDMVPPANLATAWTLIAATYTPTSTRVGYFQTATGWVMGPAATPKAAGAVGAIVSPTITGTTIFGTPSSTILAVQVVRKALTDADLVVEAAEAVKFALSQNQTL